MLQSPRGRNGSGGMTARPRVRLGLRGLGRRNLRLRHLDQLAEVAGARAVADVEHQRRLLAGEELTEMAELRDAGVSVVETQPDTLSSCIEAARPDIVQLHRPDRVLIAETLRSGVPVVPVLHAIEAYLNRATWHALAGLIERAPVTVAVSDGVKVFFEQRLGLDKSVRVILNETPLNHYAVAGVTFGEKAETSGAAFLADKLIWAEGESLLG